MHVCLLHKHKTDHWQPCKKQFNLLCILDTQELRVAEEDSDEDGVPAPHHGNLPAPEHAEHTPQPDCKESTSGNEVGLVEDEEVAMDIFEALGGGDGMGAIPPDSIPDLPMELQRMHKAATTLLWPSHCCC